MRKILQDEDQFKVDAKNFSLKEMAEKYGMEECTVSKWKKSLDVLTVPKTLSLPDKDVFSEEIKLFPNVELARKYGVGLRTVSKWRKKLGLANVWHKEVVDWDVFDKDAVTMRLKELCVKYGASLSVIKLWKQKRLLTTGKKEDRKVVWEVDGDGCWVCTSHKCDGAGYPQCNPEGMVAKRMWVEKNGSWPSELICIHTCDNKLCVNPDHIVPGTMRENQEGMAERNRSPWGMRCGARKLTSEEAIRVYSFKDSGISQRKVGEMFGVSGSTICYIWNDVTWWRDNEGVENFTVLLTKHRKGNKLTLREVESVRSMKGKLSSTKTAKVYRISQRMVIKIWNNEAWKIVGGAV